MSEHDGAHRIVNETDRRPEMRRYSILGRRYCTAMHCEIGQCDTNPQAIVDAAKQQHVLLAVSSSGRKRRARKYEHVHFIDNMRVAAAAASGTNDPHMPDHCRHLL